MVRLRFAVALALIGLVAVGMPAGAAPKAGIHGGGFLKDFDGNKTTLSISAFDDLVLGDKGEAQLVRHLPGSKADPVHITLGCVNVLRSTGIAAGFGSDARTYLIVVKDNGEGQDAPDAFAVVEMLGAQVYCLGGLVPTDVRLGLIQGGNFQVTDGS